MTWFKVDDTLHSHTKAMRAGDAAMGLWVLAGSWASNQLTDGWVPAYAARRLSSNADELAATLVRVGLWVPGEHEGEPGWWFHSWQEYQPSREDVETKRADARERMRKIRARGTIHRTEPAEDGSPDVRANNADVRANEPRTNTERSQHVRDPRPDPSRPEVPSTEVTSVETRKRATGRATRIPDDFDVTPEMVQWAREHTPLVGRTETDKFVDYWRAKSGQSATKRDWVATWRNWMRRAQEDAERRTPARAGQTTKADRIDALDAFLVADEPRLRALPGGAA
ncbi:hypothetical protein ACH347_34800 [Saccharopolyspora sp. 5N102]|uniref:hypothetical protein n=1 Tax=Saccharopolyspora sp. 5N102 TaxID=3375155 RepID=UPI0037BA52F3